MQSVVAVIVAIWFFRSARAVGKSGVAWAIGGVLAFLAPSLPWLLFVRASLLPKLVKSNLSDFAETAVAVSLGLVGVGLGLLVAYLLYRANLRKPAVPDPAT